MSLKEAGRAGVLRLVLEGQLALQDAARHLGVSLRQVRRLRDRFRKRGVRGLVHGNRGRHPWNRLPEPERHQILKLAQGPYAGFNDTHLAEVLAEREGLAVSRETLRSWLRSQGLPPKRRRRPRQHRRRRDPSPCRGMMLQWDGSPHRWLGPGQPLCSLMAALDDADGKALSAFFATTEGSIEYLRLLEGVLLSAGIPQSIYQDRHGALRRNDGHWTLEEQLAGEQHPTQVGAALRELAIQPIFAHSPQGKGRIERFFGIAQDRLLAELRHRSITTLEDANRYLQQEWLPDFNRRFGRTPARSHSLYRPTKGLDLQKILSFRYSRTVAADHTVTLGQLRLHIPPGPRSRSYAKAQVDVRQHLDGSWSIYYQNRRIAHAPPTVLHEPQRVEIKNRRTRTTKGAREAILLYLPAHDLSLTSPISTRGYP